jgi:DNA-binding MarR family transcriptional regulator
MGDVTNAPWLDDREQRAWRGFLHMQSQVRARTARELIRATGLSASDYEVLVLLSESPEGRLRAFEIGASSGWEKSRLSHHLTRMEQRGLVQRQTCSADPRYADIVLTDAGRTAIVEAAPLHVSHVRSIFFDALSRDQVEALISVSETVLDRLTKLDCAEEE